MLDRRLDLSALQKLAAARNSCGRETFVASPLLLDLVELLVPTELGLGRGPVADRQQCHRQSVAQFGMLGSASYRLSIGGDRGLRSTGPVQRACQIDAHVDGLGRLGRTALEEWQSLGVSALPEVEPSELVARRKCTTARFNRPREHGLRTVRIAVLPERRAEIQERLGLRSTRLDKGDEHRLGSPKTSIEYQRATESGGDDSVLGCQLRSRLEQFRRQAMKAESVPSLGRLEQPANRGGLIAEPHKRLRDTDPASDRPPLEHHRPPKTLERRAQLTCGEGCVPLCEHSLQLGRRIGTRGRRTRQDQETPKELHPHASGYRRESSSLFAIILMVKAFRIFFVVLLSLCADLASGQSRLPGVQATRSEFEAVCKRLTNSDNSFFGTAMVSDLQNRLSAGGLDPATEISIRMNLGIELIRLGRLEEAIEVGSAPVLQSQAEARSSRLLLLAVARMQLAEEQNCVDYHDASSCILPLKPEAVHRQPEETRHAGDLYLEYLEQQPNDHHIRWLLNLTRMLSGDFPGGVPEQHRLPADTFDSEVDFPSWPDAAPELGINAFDLAGGAVVDDFDGDGMLDLVSTSWHPCEPMKAFRNDGRGGFEDVTSAWGLDGQLGGLNLVHADYDGDGMLDLLVLRGAWLGSDGRIRNSLLRNDLRREAGRFVDVSSFAGIAYPAYPTQAAAWADYDNDGDLDLYIGNEASESSLMRYGAGGAPYPSQLYRNDGDGTFTDVARIAGVANHRYAKGVAWGDYDNDGDPDLYVSNFSENRLYRNDEERGFTDVAPEIGGLGPTEASFATWFFDWDNDGDLDIFVNDYGTPAHEIAGWYFGTRRQGGQPLLHRNDGDRFTTLSSEIGLAQPLLPMGANHGDLDNDGFDDIFLGTGVPDYDAIMPNAVYLNRSGRGFDDVTFAGGFGHLQKGHGVAFGDVDNDGDLDVFHQLGGAYPFDGFGNALFRNPGSARSWVVLRLEGKSANRLAVGARIEVRVRTDGQPRSIHKLVGSGGSFGGSSLQQEIGLDTADAIDEIIIRWPGSGLVQSFPGPIAPNSHYELTEGEATLRRLELPRVTLHGADGAHHQGATQ